MGVFATLEVRIRWWESIFVRDEDNGVAGQSLLGGSLALAALVGMAFDHGGRTWAVFAEQSGAEAGEVRDIFLGESLVECR